MTRRRGWPKPEPITEVVVEAGGIRSRTRHGDPYRAACRAVRSVIDHFSRGDR